MALRTVVLPQAKQDIRDGADFYGESDAGAKSRFRKAVVRKIDGLHPYPLKHREYVPGIHIAIAEPFPFGVFFRIYGEKRVVIAVLDLRQEPERRIRQLLGRI